MAISLPLLEFAIETMSNTSATTIKHFGVNAAAIIKENENINHSVSYPSRPERVAKLLAVEGTC